LFFIYPPSLQKVLITGVLICIGLLIAGHRILSRLDLLKPKRLKEEMYSYHYDVLLFIWTVSLVLFFVVALFHSNPAAGEGGTNILGHMTGVASGFIVAAVILRWHT